MSTLIVRILAIIGAISALFLAGNSENFKPVVTEAVTTETVKIVVEAENKGLITVGNPRVRSIEKLENDEWTEVGAYTSFTEEYTLYYFSSLYRESISFKGMGMTETLPEGEYRVVITYSFKSRLDSSQKTDYAYFTVTAE